MSELLNVENQELANVKESGQNEVIEGTTNVQSIAQSSDVTASLAKIPADADVVSQLEVVTEQLTEAKKIYSNMDEKTKREIDAFIPKIDITNTQLVRNYGKNCEDQNKSFCDNYLSYAKGSSAEREVKKVLVKLVDELNSNKITAETGFFSKIFLSAKQQEQKMKVRLQSIDQVIDDIEDEMTVLSGNLDEAKVDIDRFVAASINNLRNLEKYIIAGELALEKFLNEQGPIYKQKMLSVGEHERIILRKEFEGYHNDFLKKLNNLRTSQSITMVTIMQLFEMRQENKLLSDNISESIMHTIPIWKQSCAIALMQARHDEAAKATVSVNKMTEQMLMDNTKKIGAGYINALKASQEGYIKPEVISNLTEQIKATLQEAQKIEDESFKKQLERSKLLAEGQKALVELASSLEREIKVAEILSSNESQTKATIGMTNGEDAPLVV